ncbi:MAG: hypothetical protein Q9214_006663 [Letrouitia sp. 1 TL-2023]
MSTIESPPKEGFERFPKNVRNTIFRYLLRRQTTLKPLENAPIRKYFKPSRHEMLLFSAGLNLLRTCKSVHREASNVLYGENIFLLNPPKIQSITQFLTTIGPLNCSYLKNLKVDFESSQLKAPVPCGLAWIEQESADIRSTLGNLADDADFDEWFAAPPHSSCTDVDHRLWIRKFFNDKIGPIDLCGLDERNPIPNCYDGCPTWWGPVSETQNNAEWMANLGPYRICDSLQSLKECTRLQTLELWFPDPQRSLVGCTLIQCCKDFLNIIRSCHNLSQLHIHGVDELALIENAVQGTRIRKIIAELNNSSKYPFLGIEAGRPNLRAYANWKLLQSKRHLIAFQLKNSGPRVDRFSLLPAEIRFRIYDFLLDRWTSSPMEFVRFTSSSPLGFCIPGLAAFFDATWPRPSNFRTQFIHFDGLMRASKLIHSDFACQLYNRSQFVFPDFDPFHLSRPSNGSIVDFLRIIGSTNRKQIRNIAICLDSDKYEYDEWGSQTRKIKPFVPCCGEGMHMFGKDERFRELADLLYDVPKLGWLHLNIDEPTELYRSPRANNQRIVNHQFQIARSVALLFAPNIPIRVLELCGYISLACAEILGQYLGVEEVLLDCFFESEVEDLPGWDPCSRPNIARLKYDRYNVQALKPNKKELEGLDVNQWPPSNSAKWTIVPREQISWEF